jgi:hypothetical protein
MNKHTFTTLERFAIFSHHGGQCFWCTEPLRLREMTVDHVIPENLQEKPDDLARLLAHYGLPDCFRINDYCNWVPCHDRCNKEKTGKPLPASPMTQHILHSLYKKAGMVREVEERLRKGKRADKLLGMVSVALESEEFVPAELEELLLEAREGEQFSRIRTQISAALSGRWYVVSIEDDLATVTNGIQWGVTPVSTKASASWTCPACGNLGPWNGVMCLSCGQRSDPFD